MTKRDIKDAFGVKGNDLIQTLIADGWITKYYQYYRPTEKMLENLCPESVEIFDAKLLNKNSRFSIIEIQQIFKCDQYVAKTILKQYFIKTPYNYYKRSDKLDELLAEGETILKLKEDKNEI